MQLVEATTGESVMESIETNVDKTVSKLEGQLESWAAKLNELVAKIEVAGEETKIDARKHLDEMKVKLSVARSRIDEAKTAGTDRWDKFKAGVEASWKELESAFNALAH